MAVGVATMVLPMHSPPGLKALSKLSLRDLVRHECFLRGAPCDLHDLHLAAQPGRHHADDLHNVRAKAAEVAVALAPDAHRSGVVHPDSCWSQSAPASEYRDGR